ncbi:MAG: patatin-like phospholipase family protein [Acidimicrobiales bacterium]
MGANRTETGRRRVAVACQGGGSHTAFTAGVLQRLLRSADHEIVAFTGTSGGAIDALLAWYGLLADGGDRAGQRLVDFWRAISAGSWPEQVVNQWALATYRALGTVVAPEVSPYLYPSFAGDRLRQVLNDHVDFAAMPALAAQHGPSMPALLVGAVEVTSGAFKIFRNAWDAGAAGPVLAVTVDAVLASAAIPTLFRAVPVEGGLYWDGLFSQNPPVRDLPEAGPEEIWVVQINPTRRDGEPTTMAEIRDRRNELAGNLSLNQELFFIEKINELVRAEAFAPGSKYRVIPVRRLEMSLDRKLDTESKLDRSPAFIGELLERGRVQAEEFLREAAMEAAPA